ncbi:MAG: hypothetical protein KF794_11585 [Xanthobacteraceae bacterium]|nr:hypothetical protein [Xanthobacteraceae bacterium]QYK44411.1 MAG: hypothetical protein KF794_11585 [Xanthobacteraceae bacterium]HMN51034.1 hypothetical protein [Xanthobacteraceae bacterium]
MKLVTAAALAALLSAIAAFATAAPASAKDAAVAANAQPFRAYGINRPLNYRFPVLPRNHSFNAQRPHHPGWQHRPRRQTGFPILRGPAVIYQNGEIGLPDEREDVTAAIPTAQPVVHRVGDTGQCNVQQVRVPGSQGRTTVNIWRC